MKQLLMRSMAVVMAASVATLVLPVTNAFGQVPAAVSATKERTTAGAPFDYTVTFTVRATRANICDIEIQVADPWDLLAPDFVFLPTNWSTQTSSQEANALYAEASGLPDEASCIKRGKTGTFRVQVLGTPPFLFNICFSDKNGNLIGSCLKLEVSSFAVYPAPSADVMVKQVGKHLEFEARPELEAFIRSMSVGIFDMSGRLLARQEVSGPTLSWKGLSADGKQLAKGVYLAVVTIQGINGEVLRKVNKFVVR